MASFLKEMASDTERITLAENTLLHGAAEMLLEDPGSDLGQTISDYEEWANDVKRLTKEIDIIMNGEDCAKQASLCDVVSQLRTDFPHLSAKAKLVDDVLMKYRRAGLDFTKADWALHEFLTLAGELEKKNEQ